MKNKFELNKCLAIVNLFGIDHEVVDGDLFINIETWDVLARAETPKRIWISSIEALARHL